jgi:hypothetical protein
MSKSFQLLTLSTFHFLQAFQKDSEPPGRIRFAKEKKSYRGHIEQMLFFSLLSHCSIGRGFFTVQNGCWRAGEKRKKERKKESKKEGLKPTTEAP